MEDLTPPDVARGNVHKMIRRTIWVLVAVGILAIVYLYIHGQSVYVNVSN